MATGGISLNQQIKMVASKLSHFKTWVRTNLVTNTYLTDNFVTKAFANSNLVLSTNTDQTLDGEYTFTNPPVLSGSRIETDSIPFTALSGWAEYTPETLPEYFHTKIPFSVIAKPLYVHLGSQTTLPDFSILTCGYFINFIIEGIITDVTIPDTIQSGQDVRLFNTCSVPVNVICPFQAFNQFYSPNGTNVFVILPKSVFEFTVIQITTGEKYIFVK